MFYETISSVDREGVSHFRRGLPFYLTRIEPAYVIFVLWFRPKNSNFQLPCQRPSSSADCARELFNGSNGSASHSKKNFLPGGCGFSVSDVISGQHLFGNYSPFMFQFYQRLGHVRWVCSHCVGH